MFSLVYNPMKIRVFVYSNEPFISTQGAGPFPWSPPCFYGSPEQTDSARGNSLGELRLLEGHVIPMAKTWNGKQCNDQI